MKKPDLKIGDALSLQKKVTPEDAGQKTGSGSMTQLLGTSALVDLMIKASVQLIDTRLEDGFITAGKNVSITHEGPSVIGDTITLTVEITEMEHHRITLKVTAWDELGVIGTGLHTRTIVNDEWLMIKLKRHRSMLENKNF